jgi:hypothetical protein
MIDQRWVLRMHHLSSLRHFLRNSGVVAQLLSFYGSYPNENAGASLHLNFHSRLNISFRARSLPRPCSLERDRRW